MSQGAYVTLVGFVAQDPNIRTTATGKQLTRLRVGAAPRYRDGETGQWRDGEASYFDVKCWNRLAEHARLSLRKGEPVIVKGKVRTSTYEDKNGQTRLSIEIMADALGHDLSRGAATYTRTQSRRPDAEADRARDGAARNLDDPGATADPDEILDEDTIEQFGRDLEDDEIAARAAAEDEEEDEADVAAASAAPF